MQKRQRPSFLRQLEERYRFGRPRPEDKAVAEPAKPRKFSLPRVYPTAVRRRRRDAHRKGAIDMSVSQFLVLAICLMLFAWIGAGAVTYGVVGLAGGGPQGEVGPPGPVGEEGIAGPVGPQGPPGDDAAQEMIKRLSAMWAVQQASVLQGGAFVPFNNSQVGSCVNYVVTGQPNAGACPGFTAPTTGSQPTGQ